MQKNALHLQEAEEGLGSLGVGRDVVDDLFVCP